MPTAWPDCWRRNSDGFRSSRLHRRWNQTACLHAYQKNIFAILQKQYFFYVWNEQTSEVRFMTSFDTTPQDISDFVALIKKTLR